MENLLRTFHMMHLHETKCIDCSWALIFSKYTIRYMEEQVISLRQLENWQNYYLFTWSIFTELKDFWILYFVRSWLYFMLKENNSKSGKGSYILFIYTDKYWIIIKMDIGKKERKKNIPLVMSRKFREVVIRDNPLDSICSSLCLIKNMLNYSTIHQD